MKIVKNKKVAERFSDLKAGDVFSFVNSYAPNISTDDIFMVADNLSIAINLNTGAIVYDDLFGAKEKVIHYSDAKLYLNK